jgi:hypothetical protein
MGEVHASCQDLWCFFEPWALHCEGTRPSDRDGDSHQRGSYRLLCSFKEYKLTHSHHPQSAYATDVVAVQRVYYNQHPTFAYQWLIVMSTQLIGFSIGGIMRRFLVSPPSMIWPSNLVLCALFNTLHSQEYAGVGNRGGVSREVSRLPSRPSSHPPSLVYVHVVLTMATEILCLRFCRNVLLV